MVKLLGAADQLVCSVEDSLRFFETKSSDTESEVTEYQKVTLSALTICCTCD
jgi:hypothetical protein